MKAIYHYRPRDSILAPILTDSSIPVSPAPIHGHSPVHNRGHSYPTGRIARHLPISRGWAEVAVCELYGPIFLRYGAGFAGLTNGISTGGNNHENHW
jgi:hypothetical protein